VIDQLKTQTPRYVAVAALVLVGLTFVLAGPRVGVGALVGGVVATADAWAITWLAKRIVSGAGFIGSGMAAGLLGVKLVLLLAVCWALLARWGADPLGFSVGLGALVIGMLLAGVDLSIREAQATRNAQMTREG
jgi:predicted Kef-type K+ transport protein